MSLVSYVKTAMNKWLLISESHDDSNPCTPCRGKPDTHDTYAQRTLPAGSLHTWQPFASHQQCWMDPIVAEKKGS
jgi:hypothetical protein